MYDTRLPAGEFGAFKSNPASVTREWRERGSVVYSPDIDRWLVTRYAAVETLLRLPTAVSGFRSDAGSFLISRNGERHRVLRREVLRGLTAAIVDALEEDIRIHARTLIRAALANGRVEAVKSLAWPLSNQLFTLLFGSTMPDATARPRWNVGIESHAWVDDPQSTWWLAARVGISKAKRMLLEPTFQDYKEAKRYVKEHFDASSAVDSITPLSRILIELHQAGTIDEEELVAIGIEFIFATTQATTTLISGALALLAADRERYQAVRRDGSQIDLFVEEVLRFDSPAQWLRRTATDDIEVDGLEIPKGAAILALIGSANRDSSVFADADVFLERRSPNPHIAFGMGPHGCPGARLARLQARVFLQELTTHVGEIQPLEPSAPTYSWVFSIRSLARLPLKLTARTAWY